MCIPVAAMAAISAVASLAGGVVGAAGSIENANMQSQIARNNANTALLNANFATQEGDIKAQDQGLKTAQTVGKIKSAFGASGVDPNSGSAADVSAAASSAGMTDAQTIRSDAARQAWGYTTQSTNFDNQAAVDTAGGTFGALTSLLSGASSAGSTWSKFGSTGGGSSDAMSTFAAGGTPMLY